MGRMVLSLLFLCGISVAQEMKVASGSLRHFADFKSEYVQTRNVDVWLPDGYSETEKYAVLYMHDGQMLFDAATTWNHQEWNVDETAGNLIETGKTQKFIVVGISSIAKIRHDDLFPQKPFESLPQKTQDSIYDIGKSVGLVPYFGGKINSDNYLKFIVKELKPFIDRTFSVKKDRAHTFTAGSSMGGLISLYAICEYPRVFGGAACLSTHWTGIYTNKNNRIPNAFITYLQRQLPAEQTHKIYFDCGDQTLDALYEPYQFRVNEIMKAKGYCKDNWITKKYPGADHSEKSWSARLEVPFIFLLRK